MPISVTTRRAKVHPLIACRFALADLLPGWAPEYAALLAACDDTIVCRPIEALPIGVNWHPTPGVTLIGDAAHLMPPVGEGANMAMLYGARLALALAGNLADVAAAVGVFEAEMFARTATIAQEAAETAAMLHSPTAAQDMARFFGGAQTPG